MYAVHHAFVQPTVRQKGGLEKAKARLGARSSIALRLRTRWSPFALEDVVCFWFLHVEIKVDISRFSFLTQTCTCKFANVFTQPTGLDRVHLNCFEHMWNSGGSHLRVHHLFAKHYEGNWSGKYSPKLVG